MLCVEGLLMAARLAPSDGIEDSGGMLTTHSGCSASILVFSLPDGSIRTALIYFITYHLNGCL